MWGPLLPGAADSLGEGEHQQRRRSSPGQGLRRAPPTGPAPTRPSCLHGNPVTAPHPKAPGSPRNPTLCLSAPCSNAPQLTPPDPGRLESCSSPGDTGSPQCSPIVSLQGWAWRRGVGPGWAATSPSSLQPALPTVAPHRGPIRQGPHTRAASQQGAMLPSKCSPSQKHCSAGPDQQNARCAEVPPSVFPHPGHFNRF